MAEKYYPGQTLDDMVRLFRTHYLTDTGWLNTAEMKEAVGPRCEPFPWMTYPAVTFLDGLVEPYHRVFEFGSGGSTHWWRARASDVVSVEHDPAWGAQTGALVRPASSAPPPLALMHYLAKVEPFADTRTANGGEPDGAYASYLAALLEQPAQSFDFIVIDGMARNTAAAIAADVLKPGGAIIFDNSDREDYARGYDILREKGFAKIDFWGPGPINPYGWCTSLFVADLKLFR